VGKHLFQTITCTDRLGSNKPGQYGSTRIKNGINFKNSKKIVDFLVAFFEQ
jgi:hypothetical protein